MSGNYSSLPFGFSSFIDLLSHYYGGLIGMDRVDNVVRAELKDLFAQRMAEFAKAEVQADKVALELAIEEEMEKLKKVQQKEKNDRKIDRKKRQRIRRKLKKEGDSETTEDCPKKETEDGKEVEEEDSLDINSAFVSNAAVKISSTKPLVPKSNSSHNDGNSIKEKKKKVISACDSKDHPVTILAIEGFNFAKEGLLDDAINKFSEALFLTPEDYRLYANRCLCYLQIHEYQKALEDSKNCVKYAPDYAVGHFRMGEAYLGLNNYQSAEQAFEQVIKLDPNCEEAFNDLIYIQMKKLMDMGFSKEKAAAAMQKMKTLNAAIEYLLHSSNDSYNGNDIQNTSCQLEESRGSDIFQSDEEGDDAFFNEIPEKECDESDKFSEAASAVSTLVSDDALVRKEYQEFRKNPSMDHSNPYHCKRLYIGNLSAKISKKFLESTFARFGPIVSIKILPSSKCAFITYDNWMSAGKAMEKLQNWSLMDGTPSVVIQYPNTDLQKLAGNSLSVVSEKIKFKSDNTRNSSAFGMRDDWCSQTMPPSSPAPSLSSVRSSYSQAVLHSPQKKKKNGVLQESNNPNRCASLYIGNIVQKVKESDLLNLFSKYGQVISVRVILEKKCAFVNFTNDNNAALAMHSLQGRSIFPGFPPMVIKYPSKAVKTINPRTSPNRNGQILGDECYNWRTLGCSLGNRCPNIHVPEHKGIALRHKTVQSFNF